MPRRLSFSELVPALEHLAALDPDGLGVELTQAGLTPEQHEAVRSLGLVTLRMHMTELGRMSLKSWDPPRGTGGDGGT